MKQPAAGFPGISKRYCAIATGAGEVLVSGIEALACMAPANLSNTFRSHCLTASRSRTSLIIAPATR